MLTWLNNPSTPTPTPSPPPPPPSPPPPPTPHHHHHHHHPPHSTRNQKYRALMFSWLLAWASCWKTIEFLVICDTMTLVWGHCYDFSPDRTRSCSHVVHCWKLNELTLRDERLRILWWRTRFLFRMRSKLCSHWMFLFQTKRTEKQQTNKTKKQTKQDECNDYLPFHLMLFVLNSSFTETLFCSYRKYKKCDRFCCMYFYVEKKGQWVTCNKLIYLKLNILRCYSGIRKIQCILAMWCQYMNYSYTFFI